MALLAFATFVTAAIVLRHRREFHKRFMLLASISIVQPALERFAVWHELHLICRDQPESHRRRCGIDPECGAKPVRGAPEIAAAECLLSERGAR